MRLSDKKNLQLLKKRNPRDDIWVVLFYHPKILPEANAETLKILAQKMKGIVRVGVLDCS